MKTYAELRKTCTAQTALRMSKRPDTPHIGDKHRIELPRGEYIEIRIRPDDFHHHDEQFNLHYLERYEKHPAEHGWLDRNDRMLVFVDRRNWAWLENTDPYDALPYLRKIRARHDAWLESREQVKETLLAAFQMLEEGTYHYTVELFDAEANSIDEYTESCGGYWEEEAAADDALDQAKYLQRLRAEDWQKTITANRAETITLRATMRQLIKELRDIKPNTFTHQTMCEKLRALRTQQLGLITS